MTPSTVKASEFVCSKWRAVEACQTIILDWISSGGLTRLRKLEADLVLLFGEWDGKHIFEEVVAVESETGPNCT